VAGLKKFGKCLYLAAAEPIKNAVIRKDKTPISIIIIFRKYVFYAGVHWRGGSILPEIGGLPPQGLGSVGDGFMSFVISATRV
jgi:hypothetical protein